MVLSNKKLKQKLREAKSELILASQSQTNSSIQNLLFSENPSKKAQESVQSLLKTTAQIPRLSKREKRREKTESLGEKTEIFGEKTEFLGEKSDFFGEKNDFLGEKGESLVKTSAQIPGLSKKEKKREKIESLGENIEFLGENVDVLGGNEVQKGEGEGEGGVEGMKVDGEIKTEKRENRKKRKREDVDNGEVKEVKRDNVNKTKKKSKKKKKLRKKKKLEKLEKVENGGLEMMDVVKDVGGNGEQVVVQTNQTMVGFNYESNENLEPCTKVYVGGIPFYSTEDDIRSYFEGCGTITEIDCMKFPESGKFRGIAIITFKTEAASERALALDGSDMGGLYLKIQPYKSERANKASPFTPAIVEGYNRIYVGNLAWDITEDDLKNLFSNCNIASIRFGLDKETGEFKGYGHVDFADSESVKTALKLDQNVVCGRPIRISCAVVKKVVVTGSTPVQQKAFSNPLTPFQQKTFSIQLKSEDSKPLEHNTNTDQANGSYISEVAVEPVSMKIKRRTCYECGEKGHLSSACPKKPATDQENPITMSGDVAKNGAVTGSTPWYQKTVSSQFKSEYSKPLEYNTNTDQANDSYISEVAVEPVSSKIKRRTCYECGEKGHLSSACPKKPATDQEIPITMTGHVAKNGAITGSTPWHQKKVSNQFKSEYSKPLEYNPSTDQANGSYISEVAVEPVSSKIKRRTCYECGEKGHLSSACPKKQATDQENPITMGRDVANNEAVTDSTPLQQRTISNQLKSEDSKPLEQSTYTNQPYGNDTSEVTPVPVSSKIKRRTCYECGEKGHLSSDCPKKQTTG